MSAKFNLLSCLICGRLDEIQLQLLGLLIYIFYEPTIQPKTYENGFKKHMAP